MLTQYEDPHFTRTVRTFLDTRFLLQYCNITQHVFGLNLKVSEILPMLLLKIIRYVPHGIGFWSED